MGNLLEYHISNNEDVWLDGFRVTYILNVCQLLRNLQFAMCEFVFGFELGMGCVDTVCDMGNTRVSHGHSIDVAHTHLRKFSGTFYTLVRFRSVNCQAISTEANTTQLCHVWRTL